MDRGSEARKEEEMHFRLKESKKCNKHDRLTFRFQSLNTVPQWRPKAMYGIQMRHQSNDGLKKVPTRRNSEAFYDCSDLSWDRRRRYHEKPDHPIQDCLCLKAILICSRVF
jgi:hypothetical protein